ncbi:MAG: hypothetical protein Q8920_11620 [Bacillota bacterium]|nr:hypothetical protein [Bacillota bacterium]
MNFKFKNIGSFKRVIAGTIAAIGISTLGFSGLTQSVQAAAINKTKAVPTVYSSTVGDVSQVKIPDGYVKANYRLNITYSSVKPSKDEVTAEKAAELGAQDLWKLFKADLSNRTIEMNYVAVNVHHPRAEWIGNIKVDETLYYQFSIDALTGELRNTAIARYLPGNIDTGMDMGLMKDPGIYIDLAKKTAEKYQFVSGNIVSAKYSVQGYSSSDVGKNVMIGIIVTSENGQQAQLEFSKVNQEFLSVQYDRAMKDIESIEKSFENRPHRNITPSKDSQPKLVVDEEN